MADTDDPTIVRGDDATVPPIAASIAERYNLLTPLGEGGFGTVFKAYDTLLHRNVAIKKLPPATSAVESDRFLREARATARLQHPNIVSIYDAGADASGLFLVLELVEGTSLAALVKDETLPPERAAEIAAQVADALDAAHAVGIVHRDVKPANILIANDGRVKVTDFGIARIAGDSHLTMHGSVIGTPRYMAPEQVDGREITPATDLFALGIVLYQMLVGETPFRGASVSEVVANISRGRWQRPSHAVTTRAPQLWRVIERLLSPVPAGRGTAAETAAELRGQASVSNGRPWIRVAVAVAIVAAIIAIVSFGRRGATPAARATAVTRVHLLHTKRDDILKVLDTLPDGRVPVSSGGLLAEIPVTLRDAGPAGVDVVAAPQDVANAVAIVKLVDALAASKFTTEPNVFTGSASSSRRVSFSGNYSPAGLITVLARATGWPLVRDASVMRVPGTVRMDVHDTPWDEVATNVIRSAGLSLWRDESVWVLESEARRHQREAGTPKKWVAFSLRRTDPESVVASIRTLIGGVGEVAWSPRSKHLVVCTTAERMADVTRVLSMIDQPSNAADAKSSPQYRGAPLSLSLRSADVGDVLKTFGALTKLSIVIDPEVRGAVSVDLHDIPWDNQFDAICRSQGLAFRIDGNVMSIMPESKQFAGPDAVDTIALKHEKPSFFRAFNDALQPHVTVVLADDQSGTLVLKGKRGPLDNAKQLAESIDRLAAAAK
jgi:serine/threonine protein kinase